MKRLVLCFFLLCLATAWAQDPPPIRVAVTTTLLETAARDLMSGNVEIIRLLPPGSCPGHFDLDPRQVTDLLSTRAFIRHDFQNGWDQTLIKSGFPSNRIVSIASLPAFTIPDNYARVCDDMVRQLTDALPEFGDILKEKSDALRAHADQVTADIRPRVQPLDGKKVLCARYQKDFCEWLGLDVVAVFQAGTDDSAWQLNRAVDRAKKSGAVAVIGNLQWGPKHLSALIEATGLPGIMLSNFPATGDPNAYWQLVESNVSALLKGLP